MSVREKLYVTGREEWREWLKRNHASKKGDLAGIL